MIVQRSAIAFFVTALGVAACSGDPGEGDPEATGGDGSTASGGTLASGGTSNSGGSVGSGGTDNSGGSIGNSGGSDGNSGGSDGNSGGSDGNSGGSDGSSGGSDGSSGGSDGTGGSAGEVTDGPCDIYEAAGTPCAAAYSPIRRIKADYTGPLYQVRVGSSNRNIGGQRVTNYDQAIVRTDGSVTIQYTTTPEAGTLLDIPQTADGFVDASVLEGACSLTAIDGKPTCTVSLLYDQSGNGSDLPVAGGGLKNGGNWAALDNFETVVVSNSKLTVAGRTVYSLYMTPRTGYRIERVGQNMPIDAEPQGVYMLADGTHAGGACCWDFGNVTTNPASYAEMNTLFFGEAYWGNGSGQPPWFGADFEAGVWMGGSVPSDPGWGGLNNPNPTGNPNSPSFAGVKFALGFLKTNDDADLTYALRMANIQTATSLTQAYRGKHPKGHVDNKGAVVLGVGGDNSNNSFGTFFEGAITVGFPTDAAEDAVLENIQSVGYGE